MKKVAAAMLLLAVAAVIALGGGGGAMAKKSHAEHCAQPRGISSLCTDVKIEIPNRHDVNLSATCKASDGTPTITTGFNLAKYIANDKGNLLVHQCNESFRFISLKRDCDFQDTCANTVLTDGRFLSSDCETPNGTYKNNVKDLDLYLAVAPDGTIRWACHWPSE